MKTKKKAWYFDLTDKSIIFASNKVRSTRLAKGTGWDSPTVSQLWVPLSHQAEGHCPIGGKAPESGTKSEDLPIQAIRACLYLSMQGVRQN